MTSALDGDMSVTEDNFYMSVTADISQQSGFLFGHSPHASIRATSGAQHERSADRHDRLHPCTRRKLLTAEFEPLHFTSLGSLISQ
jgi:hypothetical protein